MRIALGAVKLIWVPVTAKTPAGAAIDLIGDPVSWAFPLPGVRPVTANWTSGLWTDGFPSLLCSPTALALTEGDWDVWLRITHAPQVEEEHVGHMTVY